MHLMASRGVTVVFLTCLLLVCLVGHAIPPLLKLLSKLYRILVCRLLNTTHSYTIGHGLIPTLSHAAKQATSSRRSSNASSSPFGDESHHCGSTPASTCGWSRQVCDEVCGGWMGRAEGKTRREA